MSTKTAFWTTYDKMKKDFWKFDQRLREYRDGKKI